MDEQAQLSRRLNLTAAKEARKRAEMDAQLLANRVALLKQEEEKAWKKIEETRRRANEIEKTRTDNESKYMAKENFYKQKWESIRSAQAHNAYSRESTKKTREDTIKAHVNAKAAYVRNAKMVSQDNLIDKKNREAQDRQANEQKTHYIKRQKEDAKRRQENERVSKLQAYQADYEARVLEEEMLQGRTEALVAKMEKEEMELIQRLQNTQTIQRSAYEELEAALGQTARPHGKTTRGDSAPQSGGPAGKGGRIRKEEPKLPEMKPAA